MSNCTVFQKTEVVNGTVVQTCYTYVSVYGIFVGGWMKLPVKLHDHTDPVLGRSKGKVLIKDIEQSLVYHIHAIRNKRIRLYKATDTGDIDMSTGSIHAEMGPINGRVLPLHRYVGMPAEWYIHAKVDSYPDNILVKYYYEPSGAWFTARLPSTSMNVGTLRENIFVHKFPNIGLIPDKYMDAVQIYYTMPYEVLRVPDGHQVQDEVPRAAEDRSNKDRLPQLGRLENSRSLQYYPHKPQEMVGAHHYYVRILDDNGEFWPKLVLDQVPLPIQYQVPKCMDLTIHTHVLSDGRIEGRDYIVPTVLYYKGRPISQQRNMQRFQDVLQQRLMEAMESTSFPADLQTDTIVAIAQAMRQSIATLPAITLQEAMEPEDRLQPGGGALYSPY